MISTDARDTPASVSEESCLTRRRALCLSAVSSWHFSFYTEISPSFTQVFTHDLCHLCHFLKITLTQSLAQFLTLSFASLPQPVSWFFRLLKRGVMESAVTWSPGHPVYLSRAPERSISRWATPSPPFDSSQYPKSHPFFFYFWKRSMKGTRDSFCLEAQAKPDIFLPLSFSRFIPLFPAILSNLDWEALPHWAGLERHAIVATDKIATNIMQLTDSDWRWSFHMFHVLSFIAIKLSRENRRQSSQETYHPQDRFRAVMANAKQV